MSRKIGTIFYVYPSAPQQCDLCGKIAELRPYGPKGECICFDCGMKDEETTRRQFEAVLNGDDSAIREDREHNDKPEGL